MSNLADTENVGKPVAMIKKCYKLDTKLEIYKVMFPLVQNLFKQLCSPPLPRGHYLFNLLSNLKNILR